MNSRNYMIDYDARERELTWTYRGCCICAGATHTAYCDTCWRGNGPIDTKFPPFPSFVFGKDVY